jgi:hypothetical protein
LSHELFTILRNISPLLTIDTCHKILHDFHIRFLARLVVNNREDALTAYRLTLQGREKLRELERGYRTHRADEPAANSLIDFKSLMKDYFDFGSAFDHACELARNSRVFLISIGLPHPYSTSTIPIDEPYAGDAGSGENWPITESYRGYLVHFAQIAEEERMRSDAYCSTWEIAGCRIAEPASRLELNSEVITILFNQWLYDSAGDTQFVRDEGGKESTNPTWRVAHRYAKWTRFADLALRLISFRMSEADAERVLSMQTNITCLHKTRFGRMAMEAQLRSAISLPTRRHDQEEVALTGADWPAWIDEHGAYERAEAMDPDINPELVDDDSDAE